MAISSIKIQAQEKWFTPVSIGTHIDKNGVKEEKLPDEKVKNIFGKDSLFAPGFHQQVVQWRDQWFQLHSDYQQKNLKDVMWFQLDTAHVITASIVQFSKSQARIYILFSYGYSRWHQYSVLLKIFLVNRNDFIDKKFFLKQEEDQYSFTFKGVGHGTSVPEMEKILGKKYDEYIGQTISYRQIYYEKYDLEIVIGNYTVKYLRKGKPNWLGSDNVEKHH